VRPAFACYPAGAEAEALAELSLRLGLPKPARRAGHDPHGRPRAEAGETFLPVSFSRCGAVRAVALGLGGRVGVDLVDPGEHLATDQLMGLAAPGERLWLEPLPEDLRRRRLWEVWACREALLKALGLGLALEPGAVELEPWGADGLRPCRVPGGAAGWEVWVGDADGPGQGLLLGLAWTRP